MSLLRNRLRTWPFNINVGAVLSGPHPFWNQVSAQTSVHGRTDWFSQEAVNKMSAPPSQNSSEIIPDEESVGSETASERSLSAPFERPKMWAVDGRKCTKRNFGVKRRKEIYPGLKTVTIKTGELHASVEPVLIYTLLGSCVSVCLHDAGKGIGGMNHILLPGRADLENFNETARYGINAMEILINNMLKLGARRDQLKAKVFGGAHVLKAIGKEYSPGVKNIEFTFNFLETEGIQILGYNVGGYLPRRVYFNTQSGIAFMKRIRARDVPDLQELEGNVERRAAVRADKPERIFLFE